MGFKPAVDIYPSEGASFNSAISANFKALYDKIIADEDKAAAEHKSHQTFAPSAFRCDRVSWFRIRGTDADPWKMDRGLKWRADQGTWMHREIQKRLSKNLGANWVEVEDYLKIRPLKFEYKTDKDPDNPYETLIEVIDPPVRFSVDGIVKIGDKYYLLEIKTSEYKPFRAMSDTKDHHVDQAKCYAALLNLDGILVMYQEREFSGEIKVFEVKIPEYQKEDIFKKMDRVMGYVKDNIAPPKMPPNDYACKFCNYKKACKEWG